MKILVVGPMPPKPDGLAKYTADLASAYEAAGHDVLVVNDDSNECRDTRVIGATTWSPTRFYRTIRAVRRYGPDLVHVQHTIASYALRLIPLWAVVVAARLRGARVVVTHHEVTRDIARLGLVGKAYYVVVSRLVHVSHVHTVRAAATVEALGVGSHSVLRSPFPIFEVPLAAKSDRLRRRHDLAADTIVILQLGFIQMEKGLRELVEGIAVLRERRPDMPFHLVVAGDVRPRPAALGRFEQADRLYLDAIRSRIRVLTLEDVVTFVGHVPDVEMSGWLATADLVTLPYVSIEQSAIAHHAIAVGAPLLATRVGGLGALLGGLPGFESLKPDDVAAAIEHALDDLDGVRTVANDLYDRLRAQAAPDRLVHDVMSSALGPTTQAAHA